MTRHTLRTTALGTTLAAALALSPAAATPARASDDTVGAIAFASVFVMVAASFLAAFRLHDDPVVVHPQQPAAAPGWTDPGGPDHVAASPDPRRLLPGACRFEVPYGHDRGTWYGSACLVQTFDYWPWLPERCEEQVDLPGRHDAVRGYDARCLAQFGYRSADRARAAYR